MFPTDAEGQQETEEERQRRLLQNEPIVVYTSLSDSRELLPMVRMRGWILVPAVATQVLCALLVLSGAGGGDLSQDGEPTPSPDQVGLYVALLLLHAFLALSMYLWNADMVTLYTVLMILVFILMVVLAIRSIFDVVAAILSIPAVLLAMSIRDLMMPHAFTIKS